MDFKEKVISWNSVSCGGIVFLIIVGIIMKELIFGTSKNTLRLEGIKLLDKCIVGCNGPIGNKYTALRDSGYMNSKDKVSSDRNCLFLGWEFSHLLFHMFLGYYYNIYISVGLSVGFEMYEKIEYNCSSYADLIINFTGFLIGAYLRK
jgi:hypothetical protein